MKKRAVLTAFVAALAAAGVLLGLLSGSRHTRPPADSADERPEARSSAALDGLQVPESRPVASPGRQAAAVEPRSVSSGLDHISGVVVNAFDDPIEGAICQVMKGSAPAGLGSIVFRPAPSRDVIASARTDTTGSFRIRVPAGFWVLRVEAEGMSPWEEGFLQAGDFRWIRLAPSRDLTVLARDPAGDAVSGAEVRLLRGEYKDPREAVLTAFTNGSGAALLRSILTGMWFVHVSHSDFVSKVEPLLSVQSGKTTMEVHLERGIRIVGRVSIAGGQPPPEPARVLFDALSGLRSSHAVECGSDGRYASRLAFSAQESLEVAALAPGFGESRKDVTFGGAQTGEYELNFVLDSLERTAIGKVVDADGRALHEVNVYVKPLALLPPETLIELLPGKNHPPLTDFDPKESWQAQMRPADSTDANGRFHVGGLSASKPYKLLLVSETHSNATLWVEEGEPGSVVDLGTVRLGRACRVCGHVRRPDGTPIEGTEVRSVTWNNISLVLPTTYQTKRPDVQRTSLESITNEDGYFSIQPFPEGEFHLMCLGTMFGPYSVPLSEPIEIVTEDVSRRDPKRRIPIVLTVVDDTRAPVGSVYAQLRRVRPELDGLATFSFNDWASWAWDLGDESGRVELDGSDEGTYRVDVKDVYGQLAEESFIIELTKEGVLREVVLYPSPDPSMPLAGVVRTTEGQPLTGIKVALIPDTGDVSCSCLNLNVSTDGSGAFIFGVFMKGDHRLVLTDPNGRHPTTNFYPARPGEPIVVTME